MTKKWPSRPAQDFRITSVQLHVEIEANHRQAGFPEVKYEVIQRRFWQLMDFLARHGYMMRPAPASLGAIGLSTVLLNSDLNDEGFAFVQRYIGKWADRLYKDKGAAAEWKFLEKWHDQFLSERVCPSSVAAAAASCR
jgi:hypothetical protein